MKHLLIEANCTFEYTAISNTNVPECCKGGIGNVSLNCLKYQEGTNTFCPYLVFGTSRATLALSEKNGEIINAVGFWGDLKLSEEEWNLKEEKWIEKCNGIIEKISEDLL